MNSEIVFKRKINLALPPGRSAFLWGARKTGKSTLLKERFPDSVYFDFLETDLYFEFVKKPALLREALVADPKDKRLAKPVILDEVQKIPQILDEVHWLIENRKLRFILCGSSARKLRKTHANLLGGRAWRYELFPLTWPEIGRERFDLVRALNRGLIPAHYLDPHHSKTLKAYVQDYLKEEIMAEGLARNIPAFSRFLDTLGYSQGELVNFTNVARDSGVDAKTIKEYFQIVADTLLGQFIHPWSTRRNRSALTAVPKFYLFDVGVAGFLAKRIILEPKGEGFGRAFEHFLLMELNAYRGYEEKDFDIRYWRTKTGHEVDFVLGDGKIAIEVKGRESIDKRDIRSLLAFQEEYKPQRSIVVYTGKLYRKSEGIEFLPYGQFLDKLWSGEIV